MLRNKWYGLMLTLPILALGCSPAWERIYECDPCLTDALDYLDLHIHSNERGIQDLAESVVPEADRVVSIPEVFLYMDGDKMLCGDPSSEGYWATDNSFYDNVIDGDWLESLVNEYYAPNKDVLHEIFSQDASGKMYLDEEKVQAYALRNMRDRSLDEIFVELRAAAFDFTFFGSMMGKVRVHEATHGFLDDRGYPNEHIDGDVWGDGNYGDLTIAHGEVTHDHFRTLDDIYLDLLTRIENSMENSLD
jgi:hypothetical protein